MDADMVAMFPKGIRALMIDDDTKFLKSATTLLSVLNFDVVRCSSIAHALKSLTSGDLIGFDVILVHAANATTCGFDFRRIVETDLLIPVIYFREEDYEATGDEAIELLRMLQAPGSYIIKKPLDIDEVRTRLWTVIAFRKCELQTNVSRGGGGGGGGGGRGDDEDRVHFKVVTKGRGRKRKSGSRSRNPGGSSAGTTVAAGGHLAAAKGKEKENVNVGSQLQAAQQNDVRAKKAQKNGGGEVYNLPQPTTTMTNVFMQSFLRILTAPPNNNPEIFMKSTVPMPSYNPMFCPGAVGPRSNATTFGNTMNTTSDTVVAPRHLYSAAAPPPLHPVAHQQEHPSAHNNAVFGNVAPSAAAAPPTTTAAATNAYELQFSQGISNQQQQQDVHPLLMFEPFPYKALTPPVTAAGGLFTGGMAGGGTTGGASAAISTEAITDDNDVHLPFLQALNLGVEQGGAKEFPGTVGTDIMYSSMAPPTAPQQVISNALDEVAMLESLLENGSPLVVPEDHQVLGMVSNLNELAALAGGAFCSNNFVPLMASQGQGTGTAAMEGDDDAAGHKEVMLTSDQYEDNDNTSFPLDTLLGDLHGPMFEPDNDDDLEGLPVGDSTGGDAVATVDGAGTSLIPGEEGGDLNGLSNLAGIDIPHDVWHLNDLPFPQPKNKNNVRK